MSPARAMPGVAGSWRNAFTRNVSPPGDRRSKVRAPFSSGPTPTNVHGPTGLSGAGRISASVACEDAERGDGAALAGAARARRAPTSAGSIARTWSTWRRVASMALRERTSSRLARSSDVSNTVIRVPFSRVLSGRRWLEIALDYRCNLRCLGCHACHDTGERLASSDAMALLRSGRAQGIESLWLGGGEPTLRDDLLSLVRAARELGYGNVTVQTNGMRLAYAEYRTALLAAGVTQVRLNVKSHRADVHDR